MGRSVGARDHSSKSGTIPSVDCWPLRGGAACLDFANTVAWRPSAKPVDGLQTYDDLVLWGLHAALVSLPASEGLLAHAARDELAARATLDRAVALREAIFRLFAALAHGDAFAQEDLAMVNAVLAVAMAHAAVMRVEDGFALRYPENEEALALPLWNVAESAAHLLVSGDWSRVRDCPGLDCGWLFLDRTKNGNRRWCDGADCGNRGRVRAHYRRHHPTLSKSEERDRATSPRAAGAPRQPRIRGPGTVD